MRCCVKGCQNDSKDGEFVGTICHPCYEFLSTMKPNNSQACKNFGITRVFVYVEGGLIQSIIADKPVDVMVLDGDVEGMDEFKEYEEFWTRDTFEAHEAWDEVEVNKDVVDNYFRQRSKK